MIGELFLCPAFCVACGAQVFSEAAEGLLAHCSMVEGLDQNGQNQSGKLALVSID
jgi:hypothetical protein